MIKLCSKEDTEGILRFLGADFSSAVISSLLLSYGTKYPFLTFYMQVIEGETAAVWSLFTGSCFLRTGEKADYEELKLMLSGLAIKKLTAERETLFSLGIEPDETGDIMALSSSFSPAVSGAYAAAEEASPRDMFDLMSYGETEGGYLPFLSDFTFRKNRNRAVVRAVNADNKTVSFALCLSVGEKSALINAVATAPEYRKKGFASLCVSSLSNELRKRNLKVYLLTDTSVNELYEKIGFCKTGEWGTKNDL